MWNEEIDQQVKALKDWDAQRPWARDWSPMDILVLARTLYTPEGSPVASSKADAILSQLSCLPRVVSRIVELPNFKERSEAALLLGARAARVGARSAMEPHLRGLSAANKALIATDMLPHAAMGGNDLCLDSLVRAGAQDASRVNGRNALMHAARSGEPGAVEALRKVSNPMGRDKVGDLALHHACVSGSSEGARELLDWEPRAARAKNNQGRTPLMQAAMSGSEACILALLPHSELNAKDADGVSALSLAAGSDEREALACARALLAAGADPESADLLGVRPLMRAVCAGRLDVLKELMPVCDPLAISDRGRTALMYAAITGDEDKALLLAPVSDFSLRCAQGLDAIEHAREAWHSALAEKLLSLSQELALGRELPMGAPAPKQRI